MTDHKSWLWRRRSSEKTIVVADTEDPSSKANAQEIHTLLAEKAELERDLKDLNNKLSFALSECNTNDELAKKHAKTAEEALAGWQRAEAKALSVEEELKEVVDQKAACEERTSQLEAALKECMQQLRFVREEKEQRIHDILAKAEKEAEDNRVIFEEQLAECGRKIASLEGEISDLGEVLFHKEGLVEELNKQRAKMGDDIDELMAKIDSLEKHNASLTYEVRVLEKELDIRNEDKDFNRRTAEAAHKQHLENVKKIAKLESECQRLRVLVASSGPGPAALTKMRNEVEFLERVPPNESRRRTPTPTRRLDYSSSPESPGRKINLLVEKLCSLEEENNVLREALQKKSNELQISRNMYARCSLKLSEAEAQLDELSKAQMIVDVTKSGLGLLGASSMSDVGSDDKASCAGSKSNGGVSSDINLMDDFAEMEKLALGDVNVASYEPGLATSISKVIKLVDGINYSETPTGDDTIRSFRNTCNDLLHGKVDLDRFAQEVASTLEWIINHCLSQKHLDCDEMTTNECNVEPPRMSVASTNGYQGAIPLLQIQSNLKEEIRHLKDEMRELKSAKKEAEEKLTAELENHKSENEDLNTQLSAARAELDDTRHRLSSLESELENKTKHCEELEAKCLGLQTQLDSLAIKDAGEATNIDQDDKQLKIASEKLAECQETIFNLEKQIKALASTQDTAVSNATAPPATITVTTPKSLSQRSSLLDKLLGEEDEDESPKTKEIICSSEPMNLPPSYQKGSLNPAFEADRMRLSFRESAGFGPLAVVPIKKQNGHGLFKRLLWRRKKNHSKRLPLPFAT